MADCLGIVTTLSGWRARMVRRMLKVRSRYCPECDPVVN